MTTIFDFVTVGLFAVLAVLYLHRSSRAQRDAVPLWHYALAALACAAANAAGNNGYLWPSVALQAAVAVFLVRLLTLSLR